MNACPSENEPKLMSITYKALQLAKTGIGQFFALIDSFGDGPISRACGVETESAVSALKALAYAVHEHLTSASRAVFSLAELLLCRSFSPLYTSLTHHIVCTEFINLISPMLWSCFFISVCSMIMITVRVSWHELVEDNGGVAADDVPQEGDAKNEDGGNGEGVDVEEPLSNVVGDETQASAMDEVVPDHKEGGMKNEDGGNGEGADIEEPLSNVVEDEPQAWQRILKM